MRSKGLYSKIKLVSTLFARKPEASDSHLLAGGGGGGWRFGDAVDTGEMSLCKESDGQYDIRTFEGLNTDFMGGGGGGCRFDVDILGLPGVRTETQIIEGLRDLNQGARKQLAAEWQIESSSCGGLCPLRCGGGERIL